MSNKFLPAVVLALAILPTSARAFVWLEAGDAGPLLGTAQTAAGVGALTNISGVITPLSDVDLYAIHIFDDLGFTASLDPGLGGSTSFDAQLWLFDAAGMGVAAIDDNSSAASSGGTLTSTFVTGPGTYYLGVTSWNNEAMSAGGLIFPDPPSWPGSDVQGTNSGAGGASALSGWSLLSNGSEGTYNIALTGVDGVAVVPEPGTLLLLGMGLAGVSGVRARRRSRKA